MANFAAMIEYRRVGKIRVNRKEIFTYPDIVARVLKDKIVIQTEFDVYTNQIIYTLFGECFDSLDEGEIVPEYETNVSTEGEEIFVIFSRTGVH